MTPSAPNQPATQTGIDVIIRVHDPLRLHELDRALFSLVAQTYAPVHPIVVTQNFSENHCQDIERVIDKHDWAFAQAHPTLLNVSSEPEQDIRVRLLNTGLAACTGRYVAFLDFDDHLFAHAYDHLIAEIERTQVAIAFGGITIRHTRQFGAGAYAFRSVEGIYKGNSVEDLLNANFCPIHSYVIDRTAIAETDLRFNEDMARFEDYELLLRLCTTYKVSFDSRDRVIGLYNWHAERFGSFIMSPNDANLSPQNKQAWDAAQTRIADLKAELTGRAG